MLKKVGIALSMGLLVLTMSTAVFADTYDDPEIIKQVQQALNEKGFDCGTPDGVAGQKTRSAIEKFKGSMGLNMDGDIDDDVLGGLGLSITTNEASNVFSDTGVITMTPKQLYDNCDDLVGCQFHTVLSVASVESNALKSNDISPDDWMFDFVLNFDDSEDLTKLYNEGDVVEVTGSIEEVMFLGSSLEKCEILSSGDEARVVLKDILEKESESQAAIDAVKASKAQSLADSKSAERDAYASECQTLSYSDIQRNPDSYKNIKCKFAGSVIQISEGWFGSLTLRIAQDGNNDAIWYVTYSYDEGEEHILEGDYVTVYGNCEGTETYTGLLGNRVTIPACEAEYIVR